METEYSADAIAAARSLQIFTVRVSLSWTRVDNDGWDMSHQYIYSACCRNCFLLILTQFSVDGYILGGLVSTYFRTPLNLLLQTYDYACSIHNEVLYLSSVNLAFWWKEYFQSGRSCFSHAGPRWRVFISLRDILLSSFSPAIYIVRLILLLCT